MDQNVLSPEQKRPLQVFKYNDINQFVDDKLNNANQSMIPVLGSMKEQNDVLQKNIYTLQTLLDSTKTETTEGNDVLREQIKWNTYFYKKYKYQTQIMWIIVGTCVIINLLHNTSSFLMFAGVTGFILSIVFVYLMYQMWDLTMRDSLNFDEYSFANYKGVYLRSTPDNGPIDISNCRVNQVAKFYD
jgi:hypothetical protein